MSEATEAGRLPFESRGYPGFEGRVGRTFAGSESWWPPRAGPPPGAPNIIVMLVDDLGFADVGCFGSEIRTPNLDRLAAEGLRFSDFHATPMCSPTRAALLTGCNPHAVGMGHVVHSDPGFPGYAMELPDDTATMAEILRDHGYSTFMVGKWHLTKDADQSDAGPRHSWPCQRGFDRYYGFLDGFTNLHHPHRLLADNNPVEVDEYPEGYYLTDDLTDRAIDMIRATKASNPHRPFFLYFAHGAVHAPLHAKEEDIAAYAGVYEAGWDAIRERRHARMIELGVLPAGTPLAPRNQEQDQEVPAWDDLSAEEQRLFARYMQVYAAMVDNIDQNLGRLRAALEELGEWDDTLLLFTSDNGASREGEQVGTTSYFTHLLGDVDWSSDLERIDLIGGPRTQPHYPRGWAMAGNTPFRLYKINAHAGGHRVPCILSWPARMAEVADRGGFRRHWAHVTDVLPTVLDLLGLDHPTERNGRTLRPLVGDSLVPMLTDPEATGDHTDQYIECWGHRGYRRGRWELVTLHLPMTPFGDHEWELYDREADPVQLHDLADQHPEVVAELAAAWEEAAWANQVYPLEEGTYLKHILRPPWVEEVRGPVTIVAGTPTLERWRSQQLIWARSFTATVDCSWAPGQQGMLVAHGDQGGGYAVYVEAEGDDGRVWFVHNDGHRCRSLDGGLLAAGDRTVTLDVTAPGGSVWTVRLLVDGEERATGEGFPLFLSIGPFEGIDVGIDRRSPVSWEVFERHGSFPYTGTVRSVHYQPGEYAPDAPVNLVDVLRTLGLRYE